MLRKSIYLFGLGFTEGNGSMKELLGGKGANLADMTSNGINVPPGFTITTEECNNYYNHKAITDSLKKDILHNLAIIEAKTKKKFGDTTAYPLLLSVRSGARASMPGMMDTILNLGLNDETVEALFKATNNRRFALDSYRRFIQMYSSIVLEIEHYDFELILSDFKLENNITLDNELTETHLAELIVSYKEYLMLKHNIQFPQDVKEQLFCATEAVFKSWMNNRAIKYRSLYNIPASCGTAVNIQSMAFGNLNNQSGTGVVFTRNPSNGKDEIYGEYLMNAQGEDVVAGIRNPLPIGMKAKNDDSMENKMPDMYAALRNVIKKLELHYKDMQDVEFTIEDGLLYILQTRNGKRSANAAIKIAHDMVTEGIIDKKTAILRIDPKSIEQIMHPQLDATFAKKVIATGLPASPGSASGKIILTSEEASIRAAQGEKVILVRHETSPEDIGGMHASCGILTACGGMTSHAAVVARGIGKPCISGCGALFIDESTQLVKINGIELKANDIITIDGSTGEVILGAVPTVQPSLSDEFYTILNWANEFHTTVVRANAETPEDCKTAIKFGARGIGLARTEHMFFEKDRILNIRKMLLIQDENERKLAMANLLQSQKEDFINIFTILNNCSVNIRFLDPPLHEFLPKASEIDAFCKDANLDVNYVSTVVKSKHEVNPMLGHRGCRLGITNAEIYKMQARAIFEAYLEVQKNGINVNLELMLPLIININELKTLINLINNEKATVEQEHKRDIKCQIGTMVELPRACLVAEELASVCDYFSFGTNDLTQTCLGISRDDCGSFMQHYIRDEIIDNDPFITLDDGVKQLILIATNKASMIKPNFKFGICGEHGGDIDSINFCVQNDFNYVSCSPYRVPMAIIVAAISSINNASN